MTDDWRARAVPAVYPSKFGASLHVPSTVKGTPQTRRIELAELDADDFARPAKAQPPSPLHGIPASVYSDMRALQCLVEKAPLAAWRIDGLKLPSVANLREHHHAKAARMKRQRAMSRASVKYPLAGCMDSTLLPPKHSNLVVLLVRVSPRALDRHDNLPSCMKACVDGIADALGTDDRSPGLHFHYAQEKGPHALRVLVVEGPTR